MRGWEGEGMDGWILLVSERAELWRDGWRGGRMEGRRGGEEREWRIDRWQEGRKIRSRLCLCNRFVLYILASLFFPFLFSLRDGVEIA